ncbi:MAG: hypothetical protein VKJ46_05925 [Leptolyngbyaceae bacterium]|nr:hypothetical protein [Leptolyngbyaceae bacterium]
MNSEPSRLDRIEALLESSARSIQALSEALVAERLERLERQERAEQEREELRQASLGLINMLVSLDEERPTLFRRLNEMTRPIETINNKVDQIAQRLEEKETP